MYVFVCVKFWVSVSRYMLLWNLAFVILEYSKFMFGWVYWDQLDANCLVLFYYTSFTLHVSDVIHIHPQERHIMHMQPDTGKCTVM